jgi:hypothetical protein
MQLKNTSKILLPKPQNLNFIKSSAESDDTLTKNIVLSNLKVCLDAFNAQ